MNYTHKAIYQNGNDEFDVVEKNIEYADCYIKITYVSGHKKEVTLTVFFYEDSSCKKAVTFKSYTFVPSVDIGSNNFIQQGYEYLKTLPEYASATDC